MTCQSAKKSVKAGTMRGLALIHVILSVFFITDVIGTIQYVLNLSPQMKAQKRTLLNYNCILHYMRIKSGSWYISNYICRSDLLQHWELGCTAADIQFCQSVTKVRTIRSITYFSIKGIWFCVEQACCVSHRWWSAKAYCIMHCISEQYNSFVMTQIVLQAATTNWRSS